MKLSRAALASQFAATYQGIGLTALCIVAGQALWRAYITSTLGALAVAIMLSTSVGSARAMTPTDLDQIVHHVKARTSPDLFNHFSLFVYVDKAESGPLAQRMYVFEKSDGDDLALIYDWPVSTGRETIEPDAHGQLRSTTTPVGFYELDPKRLYVDHTSSQWEEPMPYALFFSWRPDGLPTGLAIHGVIGSPAGVLGQRASAGCVHLSAENAHTLYDLVESEFRGPAPELVYRESTGAVSSDGLLAHNSNGSLRMDRGYSVLVMVDDFDGTNQVSWLVR
jgi:hypothetical protein